MRVFLLLLILDSPYIFDIDQSLDIVLLL